ncbi:MAG: outer membrane lipoprotein carrier protein LolA [Maricaulaceae bacterium]|jgi:outer membrane lipoprotein-sorting protein
MRTLLVTAAAAALAACASAVAPDPAPAAEPEAPATEAPAPAAESAETDLGLRPDEAGETTDEAPAEDTAGDTTQITPPAEAPLPAPVELNLDEIVPEVDAYLAELDMLTGSFVQIEPSGDISEGEFWIDRPGKMRFEYADPHPFTLIADGAQYIVWDRELEAMNTEVPLRETPLNMFLRRDVEIGRDAEVIDAWERDGELWLTLEDNDERVEGQLTLVFARPALELRRFVTTDPDGQQTHVVLTDTSRPERIDQTLFLSPEQPRRRERR